MIDPATQMSQVVVAFTAPAPNPTHFVGVMVGYHDHPTVLIDTGDGFQRAWAAHLCRPPTVEETIEYWRSRALAAEARGGPHG